MSEDLLWVGFYLITLVGLGVATGAGGVLRAPRPSAWGWVLVLGAGCLGYGSFLLALLGLAPSRLSLAALWVPILVGIARHRSRRGGSPPAAGSGPPDPVAALPLLFLLTCVLGVAIDGLSSRIYEWDTFAIWDYKARILASEGLVPRPDYFSDLTLSYSHLDYPLMVPFLGAGIYGAVGHTETPFARLPLVVLYLGLVLLFYGFARKSLRPWAAGVVTAIVVGAPVLLRWAAAGTADVPLTVFYTGAVLFLLDGVETVRWRSACLCGVLSAFAAFSKHEGLMLAVLLGTLWLVPALRGGLDRRRWFAFGGFAGVFGALYLPWMWWAREIPRTHTDFVSQLRISEIVSNLERLPVILEAVGAQLADVWQFGLLWPLLLLSAWLGRRAFESRSTRTAWLLLLGHLAAYVLVFLITPWDLRAHLDSALERLVLHLVPLAGVLIVLHLSRLLPSLQYHQSRPISSGSVR